MGRGAAPFASASRQTALPLDLPTPVLARRPVATCARLARVQIPQMDAEQRERGYNALMEMLLAAETINVTQSDMVKASYEKIDYAFMQKLATEIETAAEEKKVPAAPESTARRASAWRRERRPHERRAPDVPRPRVGARAPFAAAQASLTAIQQLINGEMQQRMSRAAEALKKMLAAGPGGMFRMLPDYMQRGLLDEPLLLLLEANIKQAQEAGAEPAANLMTRLMQQVRLEIDKQVEPEVRLLRELMRIDSSDARKELLKQKIAPKEVQILIAGARDQGPQSTEPEVKIRKFAAALVKLKSQFGNIDEVTEKLGEIANEAEDVAREFGTGSDMTPQELQDLMWEKGSVSVWDLEKVEQEAEETGGSAPWEDEAQQRLKGLQSDDLLQP